MKNIVPGRLEWNLLMAYINVLKPTFSDAFWTIFLFISSLNVDWAVMEENKLFAKRSNFGFLQFWGSVSMRHYITLTLVHRLRLKGYTGSMVVIQFTDGQIYLLEQNKHTESWMFLKIHHAAWCLSLKNTHSICP